MLYAEKKNRMLQIPDEKKDEYIRMGYSISTMDGKVVYQHMNQEQKLEFIEAENEKLKAEVEELKFENEKLKAEVEESKKNTSGNMAAGNEDSAGKKTPKANKKTE